MRRLVPAVLSAFLAVGLLSGPAPVGVETVAAAEPATPASRFTPLSPVRVLDTRYGVGGTTGPITRDLRLDLTQDLPANATGVALNLTGVDATAPTHVTAWTSVGTAPEASTLTCPRGRPSRTASWWPSRTSGTSCCTTTPARCT